MIFNLNFNLKLKKMTTKYIDLGLIDYQEAWDYQENKLTELLKNREKERVENTGYVLFCEHPHVYTLGKSGKENNLLISDEFLKKINATYYQTNRGGDITYHGPGQIVGYPIIDLITYNLGVKSYIFKLEESIINFLKDFDIEASRLEKATGVWLDADKPTARKICAIGVRVSRSITMHGFALNINTDLNYFSYINPCGFQDKGVTSLEKELGRKIDMGEARKLLLEKINKEFGFK